MVQTNPQDPEAPKTPILGHDGPITDSAFDADLDLRNRRRETRRRQVKIVALIVVLLVLQVAAVQTIKRTFFAVRTPKLRLGAVAVRSSNATSTAAAASFRIGLEAELAIANPNFGKFEYYYSGYGNLTVAVSYRGAKVGEGVVVEGSAGARKTKRVDVSLDLSSGGLPASSGSGLRSDVEGGSLVLTCQGKLSGFVDVLRIVRENVEPELSCTMTVLLASKTVQDLVCL